MCLWCLSSCTCAVVQREWAQVSPWSGPLRWFFWDSRNPVSLSPDPCWFLQPGVMGTYLTGPGTLGWGCSCGPGLLAPQGELCSSDIHPDFYPPLLGVGQAIQCLHPAFYSWCGFFFNSIVVGLPFSKISGSSEWWLFCSVVVILMWLWEEASTVFMYAIVLTGNWELLLSLLFFFFTINVTWYYPTFSEIHLLNTLII